MAGLDEDGDQGEGAVSGEVVAFEIDEEAWLGAGLWQVVEKSLQGGCGVDHFDVHLCVIWLVGDWVGGGVFRKTIAGGIL